VAVRHSSDADALACSLFARHQRSIYRHCLYSLRSKHDAEDALQQTFVNALQALRTGVTPRFEAAWLLQIARNVCLERHRNAGRRARIEVVASPDSLVGIAASPTSDDDWSELGAALARIDQRQRDALVLREWRGLSYREIAGVLQLSQSAVEALLFRARRSLARALEDAQLLRPTFSWASVHASWRTVFSGAAAKTAAVAACCGITVVAVPALEHAIAPRADRAIANAPASTTLEPGVTGRETALPEVKSTRDPKRSRTGPLQARPARNAPTTSGGSSTPVSGARPVGPGETGGATGSGGTGVETGTGGERPGGGSAGAPNGGDGNPTAAGLALPLTEPAGGSDASAQISVGDTTISAGVGVSTDGGDAGIDASVQLDVSPPGVNGSDPAAGSPGQTVGADADVSVATSDDSPVTATADATVSTGQLLPSVDVTVGISLP
jgi:RNA polymerase sigma-70 factor (ECF subfamily)